jgi:hypothetical protein
LGLRAEDCGKRFSTPGTPELGAGTGAELGEILGAESGNLVTLSVRQKMFDQITWLHFPQCRRRGIRREESV